MSKMTIEAMIRDAAEAQIALTELPREPFRGVQQFIITNSGDAEIDKLLTATLNYQWRNRATADKAEGGR